MLGQSQKAQSERRKAKKVQGAGHKAHGESTGRM